MIEAEYRLDDQSIDAISESAQDFLKQIGVERKNLQRMRLTLEDILLKWQKQFDEQTSVVFKAGKKMGRPMMSLSLQGEKYDPIEETDEEFGEYSSHIMSHMGLRPMFSYEKGRNHILFKLKRKPMNPLMALSIAVVLAIIIGFAGQLLPDVFRLNFTEHVLTPIYDTFLGILATIAGPMIFLSVAWGIYGIGDAETLGRIGKRMLLRFAVITALITAIATVVYLPIYGITFAKSQAGENEFHSILDLILNIFPKNIVSPFADGNTMQIILIAVVVGIVMLILGQQTEQVAVLIEQVNYIIQYLMELIGSLVAGFVFIVLLQLIWSDSLSIIVTAWKPLLYFVILSLIIVFAIILIVSIKEKVSISILIKKMFPTFLIALTTASSSASFGTNITCCEKDLGINSRICSFGIPLGIVLYKPIVAVSFVSIALYFSKIYDVRASLSWVIMAIIVVTIVTIALPPIPGGALACYTIIFSQLGIPAQALGLVVVFDILFDFIGTGFSMTLLQCELVLEADIMKLLDKEKLRRNHVIR